jgi:hypothetical protein
MFRSLGFGQHLDELRAGVEQLAQPRVGDLLNHAHC